MAEKVIIENRILGPDFVSSAGAKKSFRSDKFPVRLSFYNNVATTETCCILPKLINKPFFTLSGEKDCPSSEGVPV
jgi:hypothetical protein